MNFVLLLAIVSSQTMVNVLQFGALGNGKFDNTAVFQKVLDQAKTHNIATVEVPPGNYLFRGKLNVPSGVTLKGSWEYVPSHTGLRDAGEAKPTDGGTTFLVRERTSSYDPMKEQTNEKAFINLNSNSSIEGVVIDYPDQVTQSPPIAYPYSIALRGNNGSVQNVELLNSYDGIDATYCARFLIRNVDGQPIHRGIVVDAIYDIGRIENVHFNPWFSFQTPVFAWEMKHGVAFEFGRSDWQYCMNTFCFGYHIGYQFVATKNGVCNGNFSGIGADDCNNAVQIDQCSPFGLLITNGEFTSFKGLNPTEVVVQKKNVGVAQFDNCAFWGPSDEIAHLEGSGMTSFADCNFVQWDSHHLGLPAIDALSGKLIVHDCDFQAKGLPIKVHKSVKSAIIHDNLVPTGVEIAPQCFTISCPKF